MTIETANRLYELRKKHNLSQEELAEKLGVSRQAVSKWERCEASPDTDNLIALAKIYNLSLDELIYGEKENDKEKEEPKVNENAEDQPYVNVDADENRVKIGPTNIIVEDEDGETVKIGLSGIKIETNRSDRHKSDDDFDDDYDDFLDDDDDDYEEDETGSIIIEKNGKININTKKSQNKHTNFWLSIPYPRICATAYLIFGCCDILGGWGKSWIIFITIPIYYSIVEAIRKRKATEFAYPVFTAFAYMYLGLYHHNWHPSWIIFVTIPIYYSVAGAIQKSIKERKNNKKA